MVSGDGSGREAPRTKVGRLIDEYDLGEDYGARLEAAWTADDGERSSLRDLADDFNRRLLATAMRAADGPTFEEGVDATYRRLTDDGVTAGARTKARRRLERKHVDVDRIEGDFVTYQAIRSYLRNERGVSYEGADEGDRIERTAENIGRLSSRLESVTESHLTRLRDADYVQLPEFRLLVSVEVFCTDCGAQHSVDEVLERGGCDCVDGGGR